MERRSGNTCNLRKCNSIIHLGICLKSHRWYMWHGLLRPSCNGNFRDSRLSGVFFIAMSRLSKVALQFGLLWHQIWQVSINGQTRLFRKINGSPWLDPFQGGHYKPYWVHHFCVKCELRLCLSFVWATEHCFSRERFSSARGHGCAFMGLGLAWAARDECLKSSWCAWTVHNVTASGVYKDRLKGLYVVARSLLLLLLTCSAWPWLGPA